MYFSCEREEFTEGDALEVQKESMELSDSLQHIRDSLEKIGGIIDYSVNVINASNATFGDNTSLKSISDKSDHANDTTNTNALKGVEVTVSQHGVKLTDTTNANGMAVFKDLRIGKVNVDIEAKGYTDASFVAKIDPEDDPNVNMYYDVLRHSGTMVPVFSTSENHATIKGKVTFEKDLTNDSSETAENLKLLANIAAANDQFNKYLYQICSDCDQANGKIVQIAYHGSQTTARTDTNGNFSIHVPATPQGLPVKLEVSEFATEQKLLLNKLHDKRTTGVQSVRTYYNDDYNPSPIPDVPGAYVEFSAPEGSVAEPPDQKAQAVAHVGESGLLSIEISEPGLGYTQAPRLVISEPDNPKGNQAKAEANIANGKVTSVNINEQGSGYTSPPDVDVQTIDDGDFGEQATADISVAYSVTDVSVANPGDGYESAPEVAISSPSGSGASAEAVMAGYVNEVEVSNGGSNYIVPPRVTASAPENGGDVTTLNTSMSDANPIHSIIISEGFDQTYEETPEVNIATNGTSEGSGATAVAELADAGEITSIEITNPGDGYEQAPTVNITGGGGSGASAYAEINGGSISNIVVAETGQGYTSKPDVEISAPSTGGTQATAEAVRAFELTSITVTNRGNGYNISYTGTGDNYINEPTVTIDGIAYDDASTAITVRPAMNIKDISPDNPGSGYETAPEINIEPVYGEGSGANATASLLYEVDEIEVLTTGSGYHYDDASVTINPPSHNEGTQATASVSLGKGIVESIELENPGEGYTAPPRVVIEGPTPGQKAQVTANISNGKLTGFTINNEGRGYPYHDNYNAVIRTYKQGASFNPRVHETAGMVESIEVTDAGAGYQTAPIVEFDNEDTGGSGAEAEATIEDGRVSGINIINPGSGYVESPEINLMVPNYVEKAVGLPVIEDGRIKGVKFSGYDFLTEGMGYVEQPEITFHPQLEGQGEGAEAKAVIQNGQIDKVIMLNQGQNYDARNYPTESKGFTILPGDKNKVFNAVANKKYIRDIYLGTGKRQTENQN
jgi:hypothetical protein